MKVAVGDKDWEFVHVYDCSGQEIFCKQYDTETQEARVFILGSKNTPILVPDGAVRFTELTADIVILGSYATDSRTGVKV